MCVIWDSAPIRTYGKAIDREAECRKKSVKMASATGRLRADSKLTVGLRKYGLCIAYFLCIELQMEVLRKLQED